MTTTIDGLAPPGSVPSAAQDGLAFIVGCQRSGTTLMRLILESHSWVQCYDEPIVYDIFSGHQPLVRRKPLIVMKVPRLTEEFGRKQFRGLPLPSSPKHHPLMIFMIRDVRDTLASMQRLQMGERSWLDSWGIPALEFKARTNPRFRDRYSEALKALSDARYPELARGALYWRYKVEALFEYSNLGYPVIPVRYEDLVSGPTIELIRVCGFLRIPWEARLMAHPMNAHDQLVDGKAIGNTDPSRSIDQASVGLWEAAFDADRAAEILKFAGNAQTVFYGTAPAR